MSRFETGLDRNWMDSDNLDKTQDVLQGTKRYKGALKQTPLLLYSSLVQATVSHSEFRRQYDKNLLKIDKSGHNVQFSNFVSIRKDC